jgi:hypothetical protein
MLKGATPDMATTWSEPCKGLEDVLGPKLLVDPGYDKTDLIMMVGFQSRGMI